MKTRPLGAAPCALVLLAGLAHADEIMYGLAGNVSPRLVTINKSNGNVLTSSSVTGHEALFGGLAAGADGTLYSIDGYNDPNPDRLFTIDRTSGAGAVVGPTGENWNFRNVTVHPGTGVLYGTRDNRLYTINASTGQVTGIANITGPGVDQVTSLAINDSGEAYATDIGDAGLYRVDLATGAATLIGNTEPGARNWFDDLAFDEDGVLWGVKANPSSVYTIDTSAGTATFRYFGSYTGLVFYDDTPPCYPDCDTSTGVGVLDIFDFLCFQNRYSQAAPYACDCDTSTGPGVCDIFDFICFQNAYAAGCP